MTRERHIDPFFEDLPAYALGALDEEDRLALEDHVEYCRVCCEELNTLLEASSALAFYAPPVEVPRRVKQRLMDQIDQESAAAPVSRRRVSVLRPRFSRSSSLTKAEPARSHSRIVQVTRPRAPYRQALVAAAVVGTFAVSVAVFVAAHSLNNKVQHMQTAIAGQATAVSGMAQKSTADAVNVSAQSTPSNADFSQIAYANEQLQRILQQQMMVSQIQSRPYAQTLVAKGTGPGEQALGTFVTARQSRPTAILAVYGLQPAPVGKVYQLWLDYDGQPHSAGTFNVDSMHYALLELPLPVGSPEYLTGSITVEPEGGSTHPTGPTVMLISPP